AVRTIFKGLAASMPALRTGFTRTARAPTMLARVYRMVVFLMAVRAVALEAAAGTYLIGSGCRDNRLFRRKTCRFGVTARQQPGAILGEVEGVLGEPLSVALERNCRMRVPLSRLLVHVRLVDVALVTVVNQRAIRVFM